ncbi:hypothetical protein GCM10009738_76040 [Kitasatospora viridis]
MGVVPQRERRKAADRAGGAYVCVTYGIVGSVTGQRKDDTFPCQGAPVTGWHPFAPAANRVRTGGGGRASVTLRLWLAPGRAVVGASRGLD